MRSKNKPAMTVAERAYVTRVKLLPCSVCDSGGGEFSPSEAHEIRQGQWFTAVALCADCHRGSHNSVGRGIWRVKKMTELDALAVTIQRLQMEISA